MKLSGKPPRGFFRFEQYLAGLRAGRILGPEGGIMSAGWRCELKKERPVGDVARHRCSSDFLLGIEAL